LTTAANNVVRPVHEKAMPVILIDAAETGGMATRRRGKLALATPVAQ
jgi:hypothetical protein